MSSGFACHLWQGRHLLRLRSPERASSWQQITCSFVDEALGPRCAELLAAGSAEGLCPAAGRAGARRQVGRVGKGATCRDGASAGAGGPKQDGGESGKLGTGKRLETEKYLHFCASRGDYNLPHALMAPCLLREGDRGTDQLETVILYSSSFHFQQLFPLKQAEAEGHTITGVQKTSGFPSTFGVVSGRGQLNRVSSLENGSVRTGWWKGEAAVLLSGWAVLRRPAQHGPRPAA